MRQNAVIVLIFIFLGEFTLRIFQPQLVYSKLLTYVNDYYAPSDFNKFTLKKNYSGKMPSQEFPGHFVTITTNAHGLRGKEIKLEKNPGTKRILILGDSYTFGLYVGDEETYPAVLEKILTEKGYPVEVINAGYADGYETDEQYVWLLNAGLQFQPDIVIYGCFSGNDINVNPVNWKTVNAEGLPTKIVDSNTYVDDFGRVRSRLKDNKTVGGELIYRIPLLRESHFFVAIEVMGERLIKKMLYPDMVEGYSMVWYPHIFGKDIAKKLGKQPSISDLDKRQSAFEKIISGMDAVSKEHNAKFLTLMIPFNFQVDPGFLKRIIHDPKELSALKEGKVGITGDFYRELGATLDKRGINYLNLKELMSADKSKKRFFPTNGEVHFNPEGCKFAAEQIADYLVSQKMLSDK